MLRELKLLKPYYPPQFLIDSKCGYTDFTPSCLTSAKRILDTFFYKEVGKEDEAWDLIDDYADSRSEFSQVAVAIDSISVITNCSSHEIDIRS